MAFLHGIGRCRVRRVGRKNGHFDDVIKPVFVLAYRRTFVQDFLRKVGGGNGNTVRNVGELVGKRANYAVILFLSILSILQVFSVKPLYRPSPYFRLLRPLPVCSFLRPRLLRPCWGNQVPVFVKA